MYLSGKTKKFTVGKKIIAAALIIIFTACLLEVSLRLGGRMILKWNLPLQPVSQIKGESDYVILCLGDSYTFGLGTDYEHSYPRQLEKLLKETFPQKKFIVHNLGIPGSNSSQLLNKLQQKIGEYKPDIAIIMAGRNDIWNLSGINTGSLLTSIDSMLKNMRVYKLIKIAEANIRNYMVTIIAKKGFVKTRQIAAIPFGKKRIKIAIKPESVQEFVIGKRFLDNKRYDLAEEHFLKALQIDCGNYNANRNLGTIYREQARYVAAEKCLKKFIVLHGKDVDPEDLSAYLELGMVYRVMDKKILARENLGKSIIDPACTYLAFNELYQTYPDTDEFYKDIESIIGTIKNKDIAVRIRLFIKYRRDGSTIDRAMRRNLRGIVDICDENKVKIIFQTYPTKDEISSNIREISEEYRIPLVDNQRIFQELFNSQGKGGLFVADMHCNSAGYKIMAENICRMLIKERIVEDAVMSKAATN